MTVRNLSSMMQPASVAVISGGLHSSSLGAVVAGSLQAMGFKGEIFSVGPRDESMEGIPNYADVEKLPKVPELAVLIAEPKAIPALIAQLGAQGTKAVVVITPGFTEGYVDPDQGLYAAMLEAAKPHLLRIVGPDSLGVIAPPAHLNASISHVQPLQGSLAFISQSSSVPAVVLDWATSRGIGFSHIISLGRMIDVDYGDMLDYLANDSSAQAILLYIDSVTHARKLMSAARFAARLKPVIVLKGRRYTERTSVCGACTGPEAGADDVYDAAFRRAGMLRVYTIEELFSAVETLGIARTSLPTGERLAILTNGFGAGMLAADALIEEGGCLAGLSPDSIAKLNSLLPPTWSRAHLIAVPAYTSGSCYASALEVLLDDRGVDAVLALHCPNAIISGTETARAVIDTLTKSLTRQKPLRVLTSWLGDGAANSTRSLFTQNRIPTYDTPNDAVRGFMQLVRFRKNQEMLMQTPPTLPEAFTPAPEKVRPIIERVIAEGRAWLTEGEVESVLGAYQIPLAPLGSTEDVIQELFIGMEEERQFGPAIQFGQSGTLSDLLQDRAWCIPPLNMHLAGELMSRTRIGRFLQRCGAPGAGGDDIALILVKVSQLVCDMDEIVEIEIDPLVVGPKSVGAAKAGIRVARSIAKAGQRLAIRPYPKELEQAIPLADGYTMLLRPVLPEDEPAYHRLFASLSPEQIFMRFMSPLKILPRNLAVRLTQIDYDREMALVLVGRNELGETELYGGVRIIADSDNDNAEFAIMLRLDMVGMGLGPMLLRRIIDYARSRGIREIFGEVLTQNRPMLKLCQVFGFKVSRIPDDPGVLHVSLELFT